VTTTSAIRLMLPSKLHVEDLSFRLLTLSSVIVSTGLIALVDDAIKRRWHSRRHRQLVLPLSSSLRMDMEYVGPRKLIDEVFNRSSHPRPATERRPSVYVEA
jgi:hypothetical protein